MPDGYRWHMGGTGESDNGSVTKTACFACSPGRAAGTSSPDLTSTGALPAVPQAAPGASRLSELRNLPGSSGLLSQDQKAVIFLKRQACDPASFVSTRAFAAHALAMRRPVRSLHISQGFIECHCKKCISCIFAMTLRV